MCGGLRNGPTSEKRRRFLALLLDAMPRAGMGGQFGAPAYQKRRKIESRFRHARLQSLGAKSRRRSLFAQRCLTSGERAEDWRSRRMGMMNASRGKKAIDRRFFRSFFFACDARKGGKGNFRTRQAWRRSAFWQSSFLGLSVGAWVGPDSGGFRCSGCPGPIKRWSSAGGGRCHGVRVWDRKSPCHACCVALFFHHLACLAARRPRRFGGAVGRC
jgi:hypothetical protein